MRVSLSARRAWIEIKNWGKFRDDILSLSARRAWIEIGLEQLKGGNNGSLSARRAWIEIHPCGLYSAVPLSLSARRAWIEIVIKNNKEYRRVVALRKESAYRHAAVLNI